MTKLSDTQLTILSAACQRDDKAVFPITAKVTGGALDKVLKSLLGKGFLEEIEHMGTGPAWRSRDDGARITLRATSAACQALGIMEAGDEEQGASDAESTKGESSSSSHAVPTTSGRTRKPRKAAQAATRAAQADEAGREPAADSAGPVAPAAAGAAKTRTDTKQAALIAMLSRPEGASLDEVVAATGWQKHTVRGAIAGALKKKLGLQVTSSKVEGRGRVYTLVQGPAA